MGRAVLDTTPGAKAIAQAQKPAGGNRWLRLVLTSPEKKMNPGHRHEISRLSTSHFECDLESPPPRGRDSLLLVVNTRRCSKTREYVPSHPFRISRKWTDEDWGLGRLQAPGHDSNMLSHPEVISQLSDHVAPISAFEFFEVLRGRKRPA